MTQLVKNLVWVISFWATFYCYFLWWNSTHSNCSRFGTEFFYAQFPSPRIFISIRQIFGELSELETDGFQNFRHFEFGFRFESYCMSRSKHTIRIITRNEYCWSALTHILTHPPTQTLTHSLTHHSTIHSPWGESAVPLLTGMTQKLQELQQLKLYHLLNFDFMFVDGFHGA